MLSVQITVLNLASVRALYNAGETSFLTVLCDSRPAQTELCRGGHLDHHDLAMTHLVMLLASFPKCAGYWMALRASYFRTSLANTIHASRRIFIEIDGYRHTRNVVILRAFVAVHWLGRVSHDNLAMHRFSSL